MTSSSKSTPNSSPSPRLQQALEALKKGEMVILIDSEDRENEGDLVLAAQFATADKINFLVRQACGLVCLALEADQVDRLGLPPMVSENQTQRKTAFTISIEAAEGVTTGISSQDRAHTIRVAADPKSARKDVVSPGHIFPLRAVPGGVLERAGHTEGSIELCKLAGLNPAAVICEIINEDGTMARKPDLEKFSQKHHIPIVTIEELIAFQMDHEEWLKPSHSAKLPLRSSQSGVEWKISAYRNIFSGAEHVAMVTDSMGKSSGSVPLVRIHSECLTGDGLGSLRCDCGQQLQNAISSISEDPAGGMVVYLKGQEGRGIGLWNKIEAYALQDQGSDTVDANVKLGFHPDARHYHEAAKILKMQGVSRIRLMTNNPHKVSELKRLGIEVVEQVEINTSVHAHNQKYLKTKQERFQHSLKLDSMGRS